MKLTKGQKNTLELVWLYRDTPSDKLVEAFFAYTDRGIKPTFQSKDLDEMLANHKQLPITVEMWKEDFRKGLLFPEDFDDDRPALRELAYKTYRDVFGTMPSLEGRIKMEFRCLSPKSG